MANQNASMVREINAPLISRRAYNALCFGLVTLSFIVMWGSYLFAQSYTFYHMLFSVGGGMIAAILIGSFVLTIVGIVLMNIGKSRQSLGLSIAGYTIFSLTFGFTTSLALQQYSIGSITYAFGITACLSGIFLILGVMFPDFFAGIGRILMVALIAVIALELITTIFFHAHQTIIDYVVVALFCGFLGYDSYQLAIDDPTVPNAIWHASDIYLDIVNILLRVLSIMDRD